MSHNNCVFSEDIRSLSDSGPKSTCCESFCPKYDHVDLLLSILWTCLPSRDTLWHQVPVAWDGCESFWSSASTHCHQLEWGVWEDSLKRAGRTSSLPYALQMSVKSVPDPPSSGLPALRTHTHTQPHNRDLSTFKMYAFLIACQISIRLDYLSVIPERNFLHSKKNHGSLLVAICINLVLFK